MVAKYWIVRGSDVRTRPGLNTSSLKMDIGLLMSADVPFGMGLVQDLLLFLPPTPVVSGEQSCMPNISFAWRTRYPKRAQTRCWVARPPCQLGYPASRYGGSASVLSPARLLPRVCCSRCSAGRVRVQRRCLVCSSAGTTSEGDLWIRGGGVAPRPPLGKGVRCPRVELVGGRRDTAVHHHNITRGRP